MTPTVKLISLAVAAPEHVISQQQAAEASARLFADRFEDFRHLARVFESAGINLAYTGERLLPSFYHRWLLSPLRIDPQTKMPVYFDQGQSPLTDTLGGSADKQIQALWEYIRQGKDMPMPKDAQP